MHIAAYERGSLFEFRILAPIMVVEIRDGMCLSRLHRLAEATGHSKEQTDSIYLIFQGDRSSSYLRAASVALLTSLGGSSLTPKACCGIQTALQSCSLVIIE